MVEWIVRRHSEHVESYSVDYRYSESVAGFEGSGFGFSCDKDGNIDRADMTPEGLENLRKCESGEYDVVCMGVVDYSYDYPVPAQIRCQCGAAVELEYELTNVCEKCERLYNLSGQELAPRDQWDYEWDDNWDEG